MAKNASDLPIVTTRNTTSMTTPSASTVAEAVLQALQTTDFPNVTTTPAGNTTKNATFPWQNVATKDWEALVFFGGCLVWLLLFLVLFWTDNFWCECLYNASKRRHAPPPAKPTTSKTSKRSAQPTLSTSAAERKPLINQSASASTTIVAGDNKNSVSTTFSRGGSAVAK